jgi:hypothetical protein
VSTWELAVLAFFAMIGQDLSLTWLVQAEARNKWVLAGLLDSVGFLLQVATFGVSIDAIIKHGLTSQTIILLVVLTAANFIGSGMGTLLGSKWIHADANVAV